MKYVMIYETNPEKISLARARGTLLMVGPYENPMDGALGIFTSREAAEEFVQGDPFVINDVVRNPRVLGWNEILS
jgi:uncharacterized protein YciI